MISLPIIPDARPRTRAECEAGPRPCPWVGCRHHLYLDVAIPGPGDGCRTIRTAIESANPPDILPDLHTLAETCALDVAEKGEHTREHVASLLGGLSRERVRQLEAFALYRIGLRAQGRDAFDMARDPVVKQDPRKTRHKGKKHGRNRGRG